MYKHYIPYSLLSLLFTCLLFSCSEDNPGEQIGEALPEMIDPVSSLEIEWLVNTEEVSLSWENPEDAYLSNVELSYYDPAKKDQKVTILLDAKSAQSDTYELKINDPSAYVFALTAINKAGARSQESSITFEEISEKSKWIFRADKLMASLVDLYLDNKPRDIWSSQYPQGGGYWDGAAVIWGHGAAFSGYTALKHATWENPELKTFIKNNYDSRLLTGVDKFRNTRNGGPEAYAVYPGDGDERYYDDNIWVGIDMVDLYELTGEAKYLNRAELVWNFVLAGTDELMNGGVYWKEGQRTKHTCSTAPAAVLAAKLYQATGTQDYLDRAKDYYDWVKETLQDPSDYLYWDSARLANDNDPNSSLEIATEKYIYNSGQPIQAAVLLYEITNEPQYLEDAQMVADAAHKRWFTPFTSYVTNKDFNILKPGHVWFQAIALRGYVALYKIDGNSTYIDDYKMTLDHAWLSNARNKNTNLINENFKGTTTQNSWEVIHQGAIVEMLSQLAMVSE